MLLGSNVESFPQAITLTTELAAVSARVLRNSSCNLEAAMKRKGQGKARYVVSPDEKVTVIFTPINVGEEFVAVSLDDKPRDPDSDSPVGFPTFSFPVTDEVHVLMFQCT